MSWLPYYLVHERHLSTSAMAWTAGLLYTMDSAAAIVSGRIADLCIRRRVSATSARKYPMIAGLLLAAVSLIACASAGPKTWLVSLAGAAIGCGLSCSGVYAVPQTLAGPRLAGRWVGMQNCVANFAGIVAPVLTGFWSSAPATSPPPSPWPPPSALQAPSPGLRRPPLRRAPPLRTSPSPKPLPPP